MATLAKNAIMSAPVVFEASVEDNDGGQYSGMCDISTLLSHLIRSLQPGQRIQQQHDVVNKFFNSPLIIIEGNDVSMLSRLDVARCNVHDLIAEAMFKEQKKPVHRVALFDEYGDITGIISQSDLVRLLARNVNVLGALKSKSIGELGLGTRAPVVVKDDVTALQAFPAMYAGGVSGVGIVDHATGQLLANLSASDMRGISRDEIDLLDCDVMRFLQCELKNVPAELRGSATKPIHVYSLHPNATIEDVLAAFAASCVHRMYVVDEQHRPLAVITLTDVLRLAVGTTATAAQQSPPAAAAAALANAQPAASLPPPSAATAAL